ncbi:MAG: DUF481 domain-containing protein, partial [Bacteroidota bacterium]
KLSWAKRDKGERIKTNTDIKLSNKRWEMHNIASYRFNNTNGSKIEDNWHELLTISYLTNKKRVMPIAFYLFDTNLLLRINSRHLAGAGFGFFQDKWQHTKLRLDLGIGYESTLYNGTEFINTLSPEPRRNKPLGLARLLHQHTFMEGKIRFSNQVVYRQSFSEGADYYLLVRPQLALGFFKSLSINFSYEYRYENVYLAVLSPRNTMFLAGLSYQIHKP